jgi:hypothetical protein
MTLLVETRTRDLRRLLPERHDPAEWHARLIGEISAYLSPAHAAVFAAPRLMSDGIAWETPAAETRRFAELTPADRGALGDALGVILSRIRRLAESGKTPAVAACWPALREIPDLSMVFACDGAPVIAGWGHVSAGASQPSGLLARYDDGVPWRPPPRPPWPLYGGAIAGLIVLALLAGLLLPLARARVFGTVAECTIDPNSRTLLADTAREQARHANLQSELAALIEERGRRRMDCTLAQLPPPPRPVPPPPPATPPASQPAPTAPQARTQPAALDRQRWDQHDLAMLEGCWHRYTNMVTKVIATGEVEPVTEWKICFDRAGRGHQSIVWSNGQRCQNPLRAEFRPDNTVHIRDLERCRGPGFFFVRGEATCHQVSETEASCPRTELEGPDAGHVVSGEFRR